METEMKECSVCKLVLALECFYKHSNGKPRDKCKECHRKYGKLYFKSRSKEVIQEKEELRQQRERGLKTCSKCNEELPLDKFRTKPKNWDKLSGICTECDKKIHKQIYLANPDKKKQTSKEWAKRNPEKRRANLLKNKDKINARRRTKSQETSQKKKTKRHADPKFNIDILMSNQIRKVLKEAGGSKQGQTWEKCVGYTIEDLAAHLESLFTDGVSWENQGSYWDIDHVIPKTWYAFSSKDDEEFKKCWALKNLQPLTKFDNVSKQNHYAGSPANRISIEELYDNNGKISEDLYRLRPNEGFNRIFQGKGRPVGGSLILQVLWEGSRQGLADSTTCQEASDGSNPALPFQEQGENSAEE